MPTNPPPVPGDGETPRSHIELRGIRALFDANKDLADSDPVVVTKFRLAAAVELAERYLAASSPSSGAAEVIARLDGYLETVYGDNDAPIPVRPSLLRLARTALSGADAASDSEDAARWRFFRRFLSVENDTENGGQFLFIHDDTASTREPTFAPGFDHTVDSLVDLAARRAAQSAEVPRG